MKNINSINVLGAPVGKYDLDSLLEAFEEAIQGDSFTAAYAVNTHSLNMTYRDKKHLEALQQGELIYTDGASILLAAKILGSSIPQRLTTTDLWPHLCRISAQKSYRVFVLGGPEGQPEAVKEQEEKKYPGLNIVGTHHGYFPMDDRKIIETINQAKPDILWIGMGDPRQSVWTELHRHELKVKLAITCGGMYKVILGQIKRAPLSWQKSGFEWLYRWFHEPLATFGRYFIGLPAFGLRVLAQKFFGHRNRKKGQV